MKKYCFYNGKIVDSGKQGLPLNDIGILRGVAIFDFLRTYNGSPFRLKDYYNRISLGSKKFGLKVPYSEKELAKILEDLRKKNKMPDCAFRIVITGGESSDGISVENKQNFYILVEDFANTPKKFYQEGGALITNEHQRQYPEIKSGSYLHASMLQKERRTAKAQEILYHHNGKITECSKSNIFIVKNNKIITPSKDILNGMTRKFALEIIKTEKIAVSERDVKLSEIWDADEVFITSSSYARIMPITRIDGKKIGDGKVGPFAKLILEKFNEMTNK